MTTAKADEEIMNKNTKKIYIARAGKEIRLAECSVCHRSLPEPMVRHNPRPLIDTGKACSKCNLTEVLPYRLKLSGVKHPEASLMNAKTIKLDVAKLTTNHKENKEFATLKKEDEK